MKRTVFPREQLNTVEILQVDTVGSRLLCKGMNPFEKTQAERFLKTGFQSACRKQGGLLRQWDGDGGFALFPSSRRPQIGSSVRAGKAFLEELLDLNAQTARAQNRDSFVRQVRLAAHRGEVLVSRDADIDSADPRDFDEFLTRLKSLAPDDDELFITEQLHGKLSAELKNQFELYKKSVVAGSLRTKLFRLRRVPVRHSEDIFKRGDDLSAITVADWRYLKTQIVGHFFNVAARNQITKGLIQYLNERSPGAQPEVLSTLIRKLTLDALQNYLRTVFERHRIRVCLWTTTRRRDKIWLKKIDCRYPPGDLIEHKTRIVCTDSVQFKVCEAYKMGEPIVTPSVRAERILGKWHDFDHGQSLKRRALMSALQIPLFVQGPGRSRQVIGVLSLDADRPDVFLLEEMALWRDELVGYLANLVLAQKLFDNNA